jgi:hypothetical protein
MGSAAPVDKDSAPDAPNAPPTATTHASLRIPDYILIKGLITLNLVKSCLRGAMGILL